MARQSANAGFFETRSEASVVKKSGGGGRKKKAEFDAQFYRNRGCEFCAAQGTCQRMPATGSKRPDIYILGEAPGEEEQRNGIQFVGKSGKLLREVIQDDRVCRFNNTICHRPPDNRTPTQIEIESCRNRVIEDIESTEPIAILAVGNVALEWCLGESGILLWRGRRVPAKIGNHRCWVYPVVHPSFLLRGGYSDRDKILFQHDIDRVYRDIKRGLGGIDLAAEGLPEDIGNLYKGVTLATQQAGLNWVAQQLEIASQQPITATDIETNCFRPYTANSKILTMAVSYGPADREETFVFPVDHPGGWWSPAEKIALKQSIKRYLLSNAIKIAHNTSFELEWFVYFFGQDILAGQARETWGDTMVQSYCLDERQRSHKLDFCCREHLGLPLKDQSDLDKSKLEQTSLDIVMRYNGTDAKYTLMLESLQSILLEENKLTDVYQAHLPRISTLVLAQAKGLVLDQKEVKKLNVAYGTVLAEIDREKHQLPEVKEFKKKHGRDYIMVGEGSRTCLELAFKGRKELSVIKDGEESFTTGDALFSKIDSKLAKLILRFRGMSKLKGTYVDSFMPGGALTYPDGRIHCIFKHTSTFPGRLSSVDPNAQNFPKRKNREVRRIIVAPDGYLMVACDYSQLEVRGIARASSDAALIEQIKNGVDIHKKYIDLLSDLAPHYFEQACDSDPKAARGIIKNSFVFPSFYGCSPGSAGNYLRAEGGDVNDNVLEQMQGELWIEYKGVRNWQRRVIRFYEDHGYVECFNGRRRHVSKNHGVMTVNEIINTGIQGSCSDIVVDAMSRLSVRAIEENRPTLQAILNIHDDISFYLKDDEAFASDINDIVTMMVHPEVEWWNTEEIPLGVEVSVGNNWGDLKPLMVASSMDV